MLRAAKKQPFFTSLKSVWSVLILIKKKSITTFPEEDVNKKMFPKKTFVIHLALVPHSGAHNTCKKHSGLQGVSCPLDIKDFLCVEYLNTLF